MADIVKMAGYRVRRLLNSEQLGSREGQGGIRGKMAFKGIKTQWLVLIGFLQPMGWLMEDVEGSTSQSPLSDDPPAHKPRAHEPLGRYVMIKPFQLPSQHVRDEPTCHPQP